MMEETKMKKNVQNRSVENENKIRALLFFFNPRAVLSGLFYSEVSRLYLCLSLVYWGGCCVLIPFVISFVYTRTHFERCWYQLTAPNSGHWLNRLTPPPQDPSVSSEYCVYAYDNIINKSIGEWIVVSASIYHYIDRLYAPRPY